MSLHSVAISASDITLCDLRLDDLDAFCFTDKRLTDVEVLVTSVVEFESQRVCLTTVDTWITR